MSKDGKDHP